MCLPSLSFKDLKWLSKESTEIPWYCGNTAKAKGKTTKEVTVMIPKLAKVIIPNPLPFKMVFCSLTNNKGGMTMIGVALMTLEAAVSPTAYTAAVLEIPTSFPSLSNTVIPFLISSDLIAKTLTIPAETTAAKGTNLPKINLVEAETLVNLGTMEFKPRATPQDAVTAMV
ncbi:hypothetical protein WICPIJ_003079 [Wickerhamomyces pijperi]|uniref:Uncharacterized protein n=1 Tax=Wickerhamomyces pijperi TaxID=599730 RepID=A0A9P8Q8I0_WICPI|nr:hypothetical protein WICPIJ_003079 [Wickerhamomyces pijperi]